MKLITLTSDFGVQSQGVGNMEAIALEISPDAKVVHLTHGIPDFDTVSAARTMESAAFMPIGYHVCVTDPGVGSERKAIAILTNRGDFLLGPDNGVLIPACRMLGGAKEIVEITNEKYMMLPVSPIFHGRHIFTPAAAHLANGVPIEELGPKLKFESLAKAPYEEATAQGNEIKSQVIHVNKFGSAHLNISYDVWDKFAIQGQTVVSKLNNHHIRFPCVKTFSDVKIGEPLIMKDDYGRVEIALNQGNLSIRYGIKVGDEIVLSKA